MFTKFYDTRLFGERDTTLAARSLVSFVLIDTVAFNEIYKRAPVVSNKDYHFSNREIIDANFFLVDKLRIIKLLCAKISIHTHTHTQDYKFLRLQYVIEVRFFYFLVQYKYFQCVHTRVMCMYAKSLYNFWIYIVKIQKEITAVFNHLE